MAPEYAIWGHLSYKVDVYGFGIVTLEIVSGRSNNSYVATDDFFCLLDWVWITSSHVCLSSFFLSSSRFLRVANRNRYCICKPNVICKHCRHVTYGIVVTLWNLLIKGWVVTMT